MAVLTINVYFDVICAWCYIGHKTLTSAIPLFQKTYPGASSDEIKVVYLPFYRDRSLPEKGVPLEQRLVSAFGEERTSIEKARVQRIGKSYGINFTLKGDIGHTRDAHRLIRFAATANGFEVQQALIERIYFRWFEVGGDIASHHFLTDCAKDVGMEEAAVIALLESANYVKEVDDLDAQARERGISCVPTYEINGIKIEGAADVETFYETLVKAKESAAAT